MPHNPGQSPAASGPVFVLSTVRTGSTLLRYCLDTHPDLYCPPELYLGQTASDLFRLIAGLEGHGVVLPPGQTVDAEVAASNPQVLNRVRGIVQEVIASYAKWQGKRIWCEKTPSNLHHLPLLEQLFPEARFVCLYRNCMDVVQSLLELSRFGYMHELHAYICASPDNTLAALVRFWLDETSLLLSFERQHPGRAYRVRYEDLVTAPASALKGVCDFLSLPWHDDLVDSIFTRPHGRGMGDPKVEYSSRIHDTSIGSGKWLPRAQLPSALLQEMDSLVAELGYSQEKPERSSPPPPVATPSPADPDIAGPASAVRQLFDERLPRLAREQASAVAAIDGSYKFVVTGEGGGEWVVDLTAGRCRILAGDATADYSLFVSSADLLAITGGSLNAVSAWMNGRVRILGSPPEGHLQQIVRLLSMA